VILLRLNQHIAQDGHRGLGTDDVEDLGQAVGEVVAVDLEFHRGEFAGKGEKLTREKSDADHLRIISLSLWAANKWDN
jgi:hypothetical protein